MPLTREQIATIAAERRRNIRKARGYDPPVIPNSVAAQYAQGIRAVAHTVTLQIEGRLLPLLQAWEKAYATRLKLDVEPTNEVEAAYKALEIINGIERDLMNQSTQLFEYSHEIATKAFTKGNKFHRKAWVGQINKIAGVDINNVINDKTVNRALLNRIDENIKLIKTVQPEYLGNVKDAVTQGLKQGDDFFSIKKRLREIKTSHEKYRPKLIARDQMNKLTGALDQIRQEDVGIKKYVWRTSGDERVRPSHVEKDGVEFAWNQPPGDTGHPGQDIQCRCVADPVLDDWIRNLSS